MLMKKLAPLNHSASAPTVLHSDQNASTNAANPATAGVDLNTRRASSRIVLTDDISEGLSPRRARCASLKASESSVHYMEVDSEAVQTFPTRMPSVHRECGVPSTRCCAKKVKKIYLAKLALAQVLWLQNVTRSQTRAVYVSPNHDGNLPFVSQDT